MRRLLAGFIIAGLGAGFLPLNSSFASEEIAPKKWSPAANSVPMKLRGAIKADSSANSRQLTNSSVKSASTALKWKAKRPSSFKLARYHSAKSKQTIKTTPVVTAKANTSIPRAEIQVAWYETAPAGENNSTIQQAATISGLDPFLDPFGDRLAQNPQSATEGTEGPASPETNTRPSDGPSRFDLEVRPQAPEIAPQGTPELPPSEGFDFQGDENNFDQFQQNLNNNLAVNCDETSGKCKSGLDVLKNSPITEISLDITPSYNPDPKLTQAEVDAEREAALAQTEPRSWINLRGQVLAEGRMFDFKNGSIHVKTADGSIVNIPFRELNEESLCFVTDNWKLPPECTLGAEDYQVRDWTMLTFSWKASGLCHKPLYFEERQLERYGHTAGPLVQPVLSGAHFFANIALLPYKVGLTPPYECVYALGNYQVGDCAPYLVPPIPLSVRGGLTAGGIYTGLGFILP